MASHHLDDEAALVAGRGGRERVDRLDDPVQGGVRTDGHVGPDEVVVDGPDQPGEDQGRVRGCRLGGDPALGDQLGQQVRPVGPEQVQPGQ